jgi:Tol biopolymer transport system component
MSAAFEELTMRHRMRKAGLVILVALGLAACGGGDRIDPNPDPAAVPVSSVTLSVEQDAVVVLTTLQLVATPRDGAGQALTGRTITWSSSDPALATVSASGQVTALRVGAVTITAASEGKTASALLSLVPLITVGRRLPTEFVGDTTLLRATLTDANGGVLSGTVTWRSSDETVATVTAHGVVTGASAGHATISAAADGAMGSAELVVLPHTSRTDREIGYLRTTIGPNATSLDELFLMQPDGSGAHRVSPEGQFVNEFEWSPAGDRIAAIYLEYNGQGKSGLYLLNPDRSGEQFVAALTGHARWSPDGERLALASGSPAHLYTVNRDGTSLRQITFTGGDQLAPEWSPDGRQIAYRQQTIFCNELWIVDADGANQHQIPVPSGMCNLAWSPDGKRIAFWSPNRGAVQTSGIWLVNSDGSDVRPLTPNCSVDGVCGGDRFYRYPVWSPDGHRLAFGSTGVVGYPSSLHLVEADGSNALEVATGPCCTETVVDAAWSPSGARLAFTSRKEAPFFYASIVVASAAGADTVTISAAESVRMPRWRP